MVFAIVLCQTSQNALRAVSILTAEAVELILSSRVLVAEPVVLAALVNVYTFVEAHDPSDLVFELVALMDCDVAFITEVGTVVLAVLSRLVSAGYAVFDLLIILKIRRITSLKLT